MLANNYNAPALDGNPDIDEVLVYRKAKRAGRHSPPVGLARHAAHAAAAARDKAGPCDHRLDRAAGHGAALRPFRPAGSHRRLRVRRGRHQRSAAAGAGDDRSMKRRRSCACSRRSVSTPPGAADAAAECGRAAGAAPGTALGPWLRRGSASHLGAQVPQRWPIEAFAAAVRALIDAGRFGSVIVWAPGDENDPQHPGDDRTAQPRCAR